MIFSSRILSKTSLVNELPKGILLSFLKQKGRERSGSPVLFLHGLFGNKNNWRSIARNVSVATGRNSYCLDLRNHGDSLHTHPKESGVLASASDVKYLLDREGLSSCILAGHSLGGRIAMQFAALFPEYLQKLVTIDVSPRSLPGSLSTIASYIEVMEQVVNEIKPDGVSILQARLMANTILSSRVEEKLVRDFLLMNLVREDNKFAWKFNLSAIKELVVNGLIREIHLPAEGPAFEGETVFIYGGKSDFFTQSDKEEVLTLFPKTVFHCIPDAGHYLHAEKPKEFLNILISCLQTTQQKETTTS